jgi:hypothetical protein
MNEQAAYDKHISVVLVWLEHATGLDYSSKALQVTIVKYVTPD